jgi:hypothetical protein
MEQLQIRSILYLIRRIRVRFPSVLIAGFRKFGPNQRPAEKVNIKLQMLSKSFFQNAGSLCTWPANSDINEILD